MLSWQRTILLIALAVVESAPAALLVTIAGGDAWAFLIGVALLGALAARLVERYLPAQLERVALLAIAVLLSVWAVKASAGGGYGMFGGWSSLVDGISGAGYVILLATLYSFWRGTFLTEHDRVTIAQIFGRVVVALIIMIGLGALPGNQTSATITVAASEVVAFFGAGLLAVALANLDETSGSRRGDWRGVVLISGSVAAVIIGGLLIMSLVSGTLGNLFGVVFQIVALIALLLISPLLFILGWIAERFAGLIDQQAVEQFIQGLQARTANAQQQATEQLQVPPWISLALQAFCFSVPILLAIALYLLVRRRRHRKPGGNEERESLLSWENIASDLGDLFAGLRRNNTAQGLRAALAQLTGNDPASRIRRSYLRLLLAAEARDLQRAPTQTPGEFLPAAASTFAKPAGAVAALTRAYERARYAPDTATADDATRAERDWNALEQGMKDDPSRR